MTKNTKKVRKNTNINSFNGKNDVGEENSVNNSKCFWAKKHNRKTTWYKKLYRALER